MWNSLPWGSVRVKTDLEKKEKEFQRLNRTFQAISNSNRAMRHAKDETEYLGEVCKIIIEDCGHAMVWIGFAENDENKTVQPVVYSGFDEGYLENLDITWADSERGRGPSGTAIRTGKICTCRNMRTDLNFEPWREEAIKRDYASSLVLPLMNDGKAFGALTIYSREPDHFSEDEIKLLADLADGLSYGIITLRLNDAKFKAEEALQESEKKYRSIVETANEGIWIVDPEYRTTYVNKRIAEMVGYTRDGMIGRSGLDFTDEEGKTILRLNMEKIQQGIGESYEFKLIQKNGSTIWTILNANPIFDKESKFQGSLSMLTDITNRKNMEDELKKTMKKLQKSNSELEQFAYVTSHDLQEPLRMITSFLQLLQRRYEGQLDSDADEFIEFAVDGANRMHELIQDLLEYSRVTTKGKEFKGMKMEESLEKALINLNVSIEENNASITHDPLPIIYGNYSQIIQLLQNLIGNAIKYRSEKTPQIHISALKENKHWLFSIKDNGIGIDPQYAARIFKIFRRLHTNKEYKGTGIGLAISKRIVEMYGGRIWVESEPRKGSTFYFTIPET